MIRRVYGLFAVPVLVLLCTGVVVAAVTGTFDQSWWSFNAGGNRQSAHYFLQDSAGQSVAIVSNSSTFRLESGFIPGLIGMQTGTPSAKHLYMPSVRTGPIGGSAGISGAVATGIQASEAVSAPLLSPTEVPPSGDATPTPESASPLQGAVDPIDPDVELSNHVYLPLMDR